MEHHQTNTIVITPQNVMASSLALTLDILATANKVAEGLGISRPFQVVQMAPGDVSIGNGRADLVVLPGLGLTTPKQVEDAFSSDDLRHVVRALITLKARGTVFATSCTGVFALGEAGMIDQKTVTTTWWLSALLQERFPETRLAAGELVIDDGGIVTAGAALAHVDLMLNLVERFAGAAVADHCRRFLVADDRRSQMPYTSTATLIASDPALRQAEAFVHQNIREPIGIGEIAAAAGLGERTFARRLNSVAAMTPTRFLQTIRVAKAMKLAKNTSLPNDEIAARVGYSDATSLRRVVKKQTGKTLEAFRIFQSER